MRNIAIVSGQNSYVVILDDKEDASLCLEEGEITKDEATVTRQTSLILSCGDDQTTKGVVSNHENLLAAVGREERGETVQLGSKVGVI